MSPVKQVVIATGAKHCTRYGIGAGPRRLDFLRSTAGCRTVDTYVNHLLNDVVLHFNNGTL